MKQFLVVVIGLMLLVGCHKATEEEILQRRLEAVSRPSYIEEKTDDSYEVMAVIDDMSNSGLVRVAVKRLNDGQILGVLDAKCSQITKGDRVHLISVDYMQTEMYTTQVFYVKK